MKFIFCFYDLNYTPEFLKSWVNLSTTLNNKEIPYNISTGDSCNAFYAKQICLKGNITQGRNQKPFQGQYNYEYIVFLSGSIVFNNNDFIKLYNNIYSNDLKFLSAKVQNRYKLTNKKQNDFELAEYLDFDMVMVKYGVIEKLTYPWFKPWVSRNKKEQAFTDIDICKRIQKEANVNLLLDPDVNIKRGEIAYA
tara:strand:- start:2253 stop:2834 length:582 start_codon:yes stop_codon:yes gene_type:complete